MTLNIKQNKAKHTKITTTVYYFTKSQIYLSIYPSIYIYLSI